MTVFPLLAPGGITLHYLVLEQPLEKGRVQVIKLDQDESVPAVRVAEKE